VANKQNLKYAQYVLQTGHAYGITEDTLGAFNGELKAIS
jgi:hypothetical protein